MHSESRSLRSTSCEPLGELLKECAAFVEGVGAKSRGSGFFIDEDLLLTCAHVTQGAKGEAVRIRPFKREPRSGTIVEILPQREIDLALVKVDRLEGELPQPAVVLDRAIADNIDYLAVGYPREVVVGTPGIEAIEYKGNARLAEDGSRPILLTLQAGGALVGSGLSGGAVMSTHSGAIVALVQYANDGYAAGGAAIPVGRAAEVFAQVQQCLDDPPLSTKRWRDVLGKEAWRQLGKTWGWRRILDITVRGSAAAWEVTAHPEVSSPYCLTGSGLPKSVAEVLFHGLSVAASGVKRTSSC